MSDPVSPGLTVSDVAQVMTARRVDAVTVMNKEGNLVGILTDNDLTRRVIAEKGDLSVLKVKDVMTTSPIFVDHDTHVTDALNEMITGQFRHLPVLKHGKPIGFLDITRCVLGSLDKLGGLIQSSTLDSVIKTPPLFLPLKTTVYEASRAMKRDNQTSVLAIDDQGNVKGIFTTKDIVLRVLAAKLDPNTTSLVRVVTPNPQTVPQNMTVVDALRFMN
ncbi:CBS-domain-containing protein, partial [Rozella allomycis CSF55]